MVIGDPLLRSRWIPSMAALAVTAQVLLVLPLSLHARVGPAVPLPRLAETTATNPGEQPARSATRSCGRASTAWGRARVVVVSGAVTCAGARRIASGYYRTADSGRRFDFPGGWIVIGWRCRPATHGTIGSCSRGKSAFYAVRTAPRCSPRVPRSVACRIR